MIWSCKAGKTQVLVPTSRFATAPGQHNDLNCTAAIQVSCAHTLLLRLELAAAIKKQVQYAHTLLAKLTAALSQHALCCLCASLVRIECTRNGLNERC